MTSLLFIPSSRLKRILAAGCSALLFAALAPPLQAATLRMAIQGEPASLAPARVNGTVFDNDVLGDLYEGLVTLDATGQYIPGVASGWQVSDDGRTYTFELREDARWSDGEPVKAVDFVTAFRTALDPKSPSVYASLFYPIEGAQQAARGEVALESIGVSAENEHQLRIELVQPITYLPALLAHIAASPLPTHLIERLGDDWSNIDEIVTNGAFAPRSWVSHDHLSAVKNPYFHAAESVALEGIDYYPMEDPAAGVQRFRAGEFDVVRSFPVGDYPRLAQQLGEQVRLSTELGVYYYALNQREGQPTSDKRVREALNLAIDREVIADKIMQGTVIPAAGFVPPGVDHYQGAQMPGLDAPLDQRQARARALLSDAGYSASPLVLRLAFNENRANRSIAIAVAAMWRAIGIETELVNAEASVHFSNLAGGQFGIGRASWIGDYDDADNFLGILQSGNAKNYGGYRDDQFDALLERAAAEQDQQRRAAILQAAEAQALDDYALLPLYFDASRNLVAEGVKGWQDNVLNRHLARWLSLQAQ